MNSLYLLLSIHTRLPRAERKTEYISLLAMLSDWLLTEEDLAELKPKQQLIDYDSFCLNCGHVFYNMSYCVSSTPLHFCQHCISNKDTDPALIAFDFLPYTFLHKFTGIPIQVIFQVLSHIYYERQYHEHKS